MNTGPSLVSNSRLALIKLEDFCVSMGEVRRMFKEASSRGRYSARILRSIQCYTARE